MYLISQLPSISVKAFVVSPWLQRRWIAVIHSELQSAGALSSEQK